MQITFINPGADAVIESILAFQTEGESGFWSDPLFDFYPQLDRNYAKSLPLPEKKSYIERTMRAVYAEQQHAIDQKISLYTQYWNACRPQITAALSEAFGVDCTSLFNHLRCHVSPNPISPRFLQAQCFEVFYLNSERGAIGLAIHELVHFVWFYVWNKLFGDSYEEYERPSLKWILSEMVVESIMRDERLCSINPYFPREHGGCIYPYFFDMTVNGTPILDTLDDMYHSQSISNFMQNSYAYCQEHEFEIRAHIQQAEL